MQRKKVEKGAKRAKGYFRQKGNRLKEESGEALFLIPSVVFFGDRSADSGARTENALDSSSAFEME